MDNSHWFFVVVMAIVVSLMVCSYYLGKQQSVIYLRGSCDIEKAERLKLKPNYYKIEEKIS